VGWGDPLAAEKAGSDMQARPPTRDLEAQRLYDEAQADMTAGRWEAATAKLQELAERERAAAASASAAPLVEHPPLERIPTSETAPTSAPRRGRTMAQRVLAWLIFAVVAWEATVLARDGLQREQPAWLWLAIYLVVVAWLITDVGGFRNRIPIFNGTPIALTIVAWCLVGMLGWLVLAAASNPAQTAVWSAWTAEVSAQRQQEAAARASAASQENAARAAAAQRTAEARPRKETAEVVDPRRLVADPNSYKGRNVVLQGKALNVEQHSGYTWINMLAQVPERTTTEAIAVETHGRNTQILKDECYRVYGTVEGTQEVRRVLTGANSNVPLVKSYLQESAPAGRSGFGCAPP
jgi:hypothetical protein